MIVWLNGPFGGGKTTLADGLCRTVPGATVAAPETVGDLLRSTLAGHALRPRDYQDLPVWRQLTGAFVAGLARHTGGHAIDTSSLTPEQTLHTDPSTPVGARPRPSGPSARSGVESTAAGSPSAVVFVPPHAPDDQVRPGMRHGGACVSL
ncbi:ATP/GTP-binding protein [Streptomyces sp. NPDC127190]|uniref:ATP/GTP-binding protein n=1 Tax=unclassified Streptomyces TaxID=2593676 RepID=UPI00363A1B1F